MVSQDAAILGLAGMDEDHAYRAMDLLVATDAEARGQEAVFFAAANLLNLEVDLLLFDTTSSFFERDGPERGAGALRVYGHSKDHRPDLPQIVIGLAVIREGIPVRCWLPVPVMATGYARWLSAQLISSQAGGLEGGRRRGR